MSLRLLIHLARQIKNTKLLQSIFESNTDHMSLVMLCGESDLKEFGCAKVFSELLVDLKKPGGTWHMCW